MKTRDALQKEDHQNTVHIRTNKREWTKDIYNIPFVTNQEVVYVVYQNSEVRCVNLRP